MKITRVYSQNVILHRRIRMLTEPTFRVKNQPFRARWRRFVRSLAFDPDTASGLMDTISLVRSIVARQLIQRSDDPLITTALKRADSDLCCAYRASQRKLIDDYHHHG